MHTHEHTYTHAQTHAPCVHTSTHKISTHVTCTNYGGKHLFHHNVGSKWSWSHLPSNLAGLPCGLHPSNPWLSLRWPSLHHSRHPGPGLHHKLHLPQRPLERLLRPPLGYRRVPVGRGGLPWMLRRAGLCFCRPGNAGQ